MGSSGYAGCDTSSKPCLVLQGETSAGRSGPTRIWVCARRVRVQESAPACAQARCPGAAAEAPL